MKKETVYMLALRRNLYSIIESISPSTESEFANPATNKTSFSVSYVYRDKSATRILRSRTAKTLSEGMRVISTWNRELSNEGLVAFERNSIKGEPQ